MYETASRHVGDYYDRTTKKTNEMIKRHKQYFAGLNDIENIVVIGHSLSCVDYPYVKEIAENAGRATWHISQHSPSDLKRMQEFVHTLGIRAVAVTLAEV